MTMTVCAVVVTTNSASHLPHLLTSLRAHPDLVLGPELDHDRPLRRFLRERDPAQADRVDRRRAS